MRLDFLIEALNDLYILVGDIQNAYLNTPTKEKTFLYAVDEWKSDQGKVIMIVRALYRLKPSDLAWRNHLYEILVNHCGFQSYLADSDVCFNAATDKTGNEYYI